jgi:hypothetical protein
MPRGNARFDATDWRKVLRKITVKGDLSVKEKQRMSVGFGRGIVSLVISIALFAGLSSSASTFQITSNPGAYPTAVSAHKGGL